MLHHGTVEKPTLELLIKLMGDKSLEDFVLVGGTALALRLGHRRSIDIDLFTNHAFNSNLLSEHLQNEFKLTLDFIADNTLRICYEIN